MDYPATNRKHELINTKKKPSNLAPSYEKGTLFIVDGIYETRKRGVTDITHVEKTKNDSSATRVGKGQPMALVVKSLSQLQFAVEW
jgi:hypothetical protein